MQLKPPSAMEDKRWSLEEEIAKLTKDILKLSFHELAEEEEPMTFPCKEVYGDYQCENVMSIWPKLRETKRPIKPIAVGQKIKKFLRRRRDMIEGVPCVHDVGFVTFKLSDKWIHKSIHKMLRDGIDTWAPKLPMERVMIHIPSIAGEETIDERLRRACIRDTLTRMLEYSKVVVSSGGYDLEAHDELDKCFSIEERDGDVVIYGRADGESKPLIRGKGDEGFNNAFNDLGALWTGLVSGNADWIVFLTPVWRQEYIKMCFTAAEHARWISDRHYGVNYAAYRTHAELRTLLEQGRGQGGSQAALDELRMLFNLLEEGFHMESLGHTPASYCECAIKYTYLRNNRLAETTFNLHEILRMKGNTLFYLLITHRRIRKITSDSCKDIDKLKRASELTLEKVEGVEKDKRHALGLHLLGFTEVLKQSCLTVLPQILCEYLYKLSEKFDDYHSSYTSVLEDGSVAKTSRLLLCEATAVVMEKCFQLLGITPVYSGNIKSTYTSGEYSGNIKSTYTSDDKAWNKQVRFRGYLSSLKKRLCVNESKDLVINPDSLSVARDPSRSSRFELIAVRPQIANPFKEGKMCGYIIVSDVYGVRVDGWVPIDNPDCGYVSLLNYDWYDAVNMENHGLVYPGNTSSGHTVPLSPSFLILMDLTVETEEGDSFFQLGYKGLRIDLSRFEGKNAADGECRSIIVKGKDMVLHMYYILLKDAVDTSLEVTFKKDADPAPDADPFKVYGEIHAFYGNNFPYSSDPIIKRDYETSLFNPDANSGLWAGPIRLRKSALSVPRNGSLVIRADLREVGSGNLIMDSSTTFTFEEAINCIPGKDCSGTKDGSILGKGCLEGWSFHVIVNWNYKASPC